jgi:small subunit ribosomal protein S29
MANLVHYGHSAGYLLVHIPWIATWTRSAKETVASTERPGFIDHTVDSVFWLTFFRHQNAKLLGESDIKTANTYDWSKRESTPAGSSITDIIDHGIARPVHAAECIYALIKEIKIASSEKRIKTMVAIDGVNGMFMDPGPRIRRQDKTIVPYQNITVFEGFKQLLTSDWSGGVVITTVDKLAFAGHQREADTPRFLLGKDGWEHMDPFIPVHVDRYSHQELQTTIDYYLERKWLQHPRAGTKEARQELETISVRNPYVLMQLCNSR